MLQTSTALAISSIAFTINILCWSHVPALPTWVRTHSPRAGMSLGGPKPWCHPGEACARCWLPLPPPGRDQD